MKNKFLTIFLGVVISMFFVNHCLATDTPIPIPKNATTTDVQKGQATFQWDWNGEIDEIKQFKILWKEETAVNWNAEYPTVDATSSPFQSQFRMAGLIPGTIYVWRIKAEAKNPAQDSGYTEDIGFETEESVYAPPADTNGDINGAPISLENPFNGIGNIKEASNALMEFLLLVAFAVGPILIIYAGFLLLTKPGDAAAITQAKKIILWTVISLSVMLFAKGIPSVVKDLFK